MVIRMSEADPDIAFIRSLQRAREKEDKPNPSIPAAAVVLKEPTEKEFQERRKGCIQDFREWTHDGWASQGWKHDEKVSPELHCVMMDKFAFGIGMMELAEGFKLSSATVFHHIKKHNREVQKFGVCSTCVMGIKYTCPDFVCVVESMVSLGSELKWDMSIPPDISDGDLERLLYERHGESETRYKAYSMWKP
jgi:hypothetical protein